MTTAEGYGIATTRGYQEGGEQRPPPQLPANEGMTLAELTEIGREVGIPAELVAEAARTV